MKNLYIFDADGTLINRDDGEWLQNTLHVVDHLVEQGHQIAIATNQGGPACRDAGWDWSDNYPTLEEVKSKYLKVARRLSATIAISFLYISKNGKHFLPKNINPQSDVASEKWRKPNCGMIDCLINQSSIDKGHAVFIGDSDDDKLAAENAGVKFVHAGEFFGRGNNE